MAAALPLGFRETFDQAGSDALEPNWADSWFIEQVSPTLTLRNYWIYHANPGLAALATEEKVCVYLAMCEWIVQSTANFIEA